MGKAFLSKSNGGGGGGIAFRVIGGTSAPSNPKPNDVWVDTNTEITSYIFSATEPEGYAQGMVWITTGTSSTVEFNALKKNGIQVYPISAKQNIDGAWVDVTAKSYQNGEWKDWIRFNVMYDNGDENETVTGGWVTKGTNINVTKNANTMKIETISGGVTSWLHTLNKIDITKYTKLIFDGIINVTGTNTETVFGINDTMQSYDSGYLAKYYASQSSDGIIEIPLSGLTGEHYVCFEVRDKNNYFEVRKLYFE